MCDICSVIYHSDTKHDISVCPVRSALYCSVCQIYGHSTMKCPDKPTWQVRKPEFIEQLVPRILLLHHNIVTQTPIVNSNPALLECPYSSVMELPEDKDGKFIRATLASYNLPSSGIKENKRVLEAFGSLIGKKVVYIQNEKEINEKQAKKKTIKVKKDS